jgi:hypothetical protein
VQDGDSAAVEQLFERYAQRLARLADRNLSRKIAGRLDGEDVVQSVFRTFFRRSARVRVTTVIPLLTPREAQAMVNEQDDDYVILVPEVVGPLIREAEDFVAQYAASRDPVHLDEAMRAWDCMRRHPSYASAPARIRRYVEHGRAMTSLRLYAARNELPDLDRALAAWKEDIERTSPQESGSWVSFLNRAKALFTRFRHTDDPSDLDESIRAFEQAFRELPEDSEEREHFVLPNLAEAVNARWARDKTPADLDRIIELLAELAGDGKPGDLDRRAHLANLGVACLERFTSRGDGQDLLRADWALERAVRDAPAAWEHSSLIFQKLAEAHLHLHRHTGEPGHLDQALAALDQSLAPRPYDLAAIVKLLVDLESRSRVAYQTTKDSHDLERWSAATELLYRHRAAIKPAGAVEYARGLVRLHRYDAGRDPADLSQAIDAFEEALSRAPPGQLAYANDLGHAYRIRFSAARDPADAERAIAVLEEALGYAAAVTPPPSETGPLLRNLADVYWDRAQLFRRPEELLPAADTRRGGRGDRDPGDGCPQVARRFALFGAVTELPRRLPDGSVPNAWGGG